MEFAFIYAMLAVLWFWLLYQRWLIAELRRGEMLHAKHLVGLQYQCDEVQRRLNCPMQGGANIPEAPGMVAGTHHDPMPKIERPGAPSLDQYEAMTKAKAVGQINEDGSFTAIPDDPPSGIEDALKLRAEAVDDVHRVTGLGRFPAGTAFTRYDQSKGWPK